MDDINRNQPSSKDKINLGHNPMSNGYASKNDTVEEDNDINNLIKQKKRQSTITYSQRMLRKADNLTKFNRKNHSEGNKHITNNDL